MVESLPAPTLASLFSPEHPVLEGNGLRDRNLCARGVYCYREISMPVLILFSRKTLDLCRLSGGRGVDSKVLSILKYQTSNTGCNEREEGLTGNIRVLILNVLA